MKHLKQLTLLHSNDMHGDFLAEKVDDKLMGGISRLSGYVQKVRREEENVVYAIAGDMFRGSLIDSEYKGLSTIEMMNLLCPDVVTLGNHEVDYGLTHLLFIEKCAKFPIINANMYVTMNHKRLFNSHIVLNVGGIKMLFIGILTEDVLDSTKRDKLIGSIVDVEEAAAEVGKICNNYRTEDIDFTVLLTHIGFEADKKLAAKLDPDWGVDIIIGGHSHTLLEKPEVVAGIPIVQAAKGTDQIGRFDISVDMDNNCIDSYTWKLVPIDAVNCPRDEALEKVLFKYKEKTDEKYNRIITRFADVYTHPCRTRETELGKILADAFKDVLGMDVMMLGSGSIRKDKLGPIITQKDLLEVMPYSDSIHQLTITGKQLKHMITYILRPESNEDTESYQYSRGIEIIFDWKKNHLDSVKFEGKPLEDDDIITVGIQDYHICNIDKFFDISLEEASKIKRPKVLSTSSRDIIEEYFSSKELVKLPPDKRLIVLE